MAKTNNNPAEASYLLAQVALAKRFAEETTGLRENPNGLGLIYDSDGVVINANDLGRHDVIEVPQAGAGSYREVFAEWGYQYVIGIYLCSSAGDWSFVVSDDKKIWKTASQEWRGPHHCGFRYYLGGVILSSEDEMSDEEVIECAVDMLGNL